MYMYDMYRMKNMMTPRLISNHRQWTESRFLLIVYTNVDIEVLDNVGLGMYMYMYADLLMSNALCV